MTADGAAWERCVESHGRPTLFAVNAEAGEPR